MASCLGGETVAMDLRTFFSKKNIFFEKKKSKFFFEKKYENFSLKKSEKKKIG